MADWQEPLRALHFGRKIALPVKVLYTIFVAILIPPYWRVYGPANFLWVSDLGLIIGLAALWLENGLLARMQAVSLLFLELVWNFDFFARLITGIHPVGISSYMFDSGKSLFVRGLSLFHVFLPFFLLWLVYHLGYDQRALAAQTIFFWFILLVCYFFTDPSENINWAFGPGNQPQRRIAPGLYLAAVLAFVPLCVYLPTHILLKAIIPTR